MTHFRLTTTMLLLAMASGALAQGTAPDYPKRPIRILVGFSAGSTADLLPRIAGQRLTEAWGQPVIVDNRPSAGGIVAAEIVAKATPDGHTLLSVSAGHAVSAALYKSLPYDTLKDFAGITRFANVPSILVVAPASGIKSVKDIIALAKAKPGTVQFASVGNGSPGHLAGELQAIRTGVPLTHIPYRGTGPAVTDLLGGQVETMFLPIHVALPHVRAGKLLALGIGSDRRHPLLPDLPTLSETVLPGMEMSAWQGVVAPTGTPAPILQRLHAEITRALQNPEVRAKLAAAGTEVLGSTPEEYAAYIRAEMTRWARIVKESGARAD